MGKTCFARGLIQEFLNDHNKIVNSPSFVLQKSYKNKMTKEKYVEPNPFELSVIQYQSRIYHYDLYRLGKAEDALQIGIDQIIKNSIRDQRIQNRIDLCLIEWPELLVDLYKNRIDVFYICKRSSLFLGQIVL